MYKIEFSYESWPTNYEFIGGLDVHTIPIHIILESRVGEIFKYEMDWESKRKIGIKDD
jgi:hypothetical protein